MTSDSGVVLLPKSRRLYRPTWFLRLRGNTRGHNLPDSPGNSLETVNSERWEEIARLYEQVLDEEPSARRAFVDRACGDDRDMEVTTLLKCFVRTASTRRRERYGLSSTVIWRSSSSTRRRS